MFIVKTCWGTPVPGGVCASKPWSFSSACKHLSQQRPPPLGAEIWSSEKFDLGGSESACSSVLLVDQSSPDFFRRTREESLSITFFPILDISIRSRDIRDRSLKLSEVDPIFARFGPQRFWGGPPNFWDLFCHAKEPSDITWQSFAAIGPRSSEISWRNNKEKNISSKT